MFGVSERNPGTFVYGVPSRKKNICIFAERFGNNRLCASRRNSTIESEVFQFVASFSAMDRNNCANRHRFSRNEKFLACEEEHSNGHRSHYEYFTTLENSVAGRLKEQLVPTRENKNTRHHQERVRANTTAPKTYPKLLAASHYKSAYGRKPAA
jgi:hypothetical protein